MEQQNSQICRLCLTTDPEKYYQMLNGKLSVMLNHFMPKNQFIIVEPYVCHQCVSSLEMSYTFKLKCLDNRDLIRNSIHDYHGNRIELHETNIENNCCLCFNTGCNLNRMEALCKYLNLFVPELELKMFAAPTVCSNCYENVQSIHTFIKMCLDVEEKINQYMVINKVSELKLTNTLDLTCAKTKSVENISQPIETHIESNPARDTSVSTKKQSDLNWIKTETIEKNPEQFETCYIQEFKVDTSLTVGINVGPCDSTNAKNVERIVEHIGDLNDTLLNKDTEIQTIDQIKSQVAEDISQQFEAHYLEDLGRCFNLTNTIHTDDEETSAATLTINDVPKKTFPCKKCDYVAVDKNDLKYHFLTHRKNCKMYECEVCSFVTRHKNVIDNHNLTHLTDEQVFWFNCNICTFRTRLQGNLDKHKLTHNKQADALKKFKCDDCSYKTMWKRDLERHQVKHRQSVFSCDFCIFSTKHERYLKQHIQRLHNTKEESLPETFYCAQCDFSTKHKRSLIPHMVIHKNIEDLEWYTCKFCPYKAKWKRSIHTHELIHLQKYKCNHCDFQTNLKRFLKEHLRGHLPLQLYTCTDCDFKSYYKQAVTQHSTKHKPPEEVKVYQCPHCQYRSKRNQDLKHHITILHLEDSEVHKCDMCPYLTKCKKRLNSHKKMLHGDCALLKKFQCTSCPFQTKYKASFLNHQFCIHKEVDEMSLISCPECNYKTKRKDLLTKHFLVHKSSSEVEMFECYHCSYKTKYKRALIKHMQSHYANYLECNKCDYKTKWKHSMKTHALKHVVERQEVKMEIDVAKVEIEWRATEEGDSVP